MSVDTYLKGKDTSRYTGVDHEGTSILLSPSLVRWAGSVALDVRRSLLRRRFAVHVAHRHTAACRH